MSEKKTYMGNWS